MVSNMCALISNFKIPNNWTYRGEGNCNVVLSLTKSRKILRIRKTDRPRTLIEWLIVWISDFIYWYCGKSINEELRDLQFYSVIMRPLIGRRFTSEANQVILTRKQIRRLENELSRIRPEFRKTKILQFGRAALFDDFAFLSEDQYDYLPFTVADKTFAVEIKPKQGWRPLNEMHFPKCVFCMNQFLKMEKKIIRKISKYCPEDLFSGNCDRMRSAIKSLIEVPQNNFRIFKNGILCFGDKIETLFSEIISEIFESAEKPESLQEEFYKLIHQCLITDFNNLNSTENCKDNLYCNGNEMDEKKVDTVLPKGCILRQILSVQMLDMKGSNHCKNILNTTNFTDWQYVNLLLSKIDNRNTCLKCAVMTLCNSSKEENDSEISLIPYMISSIAKDCSLMITFKKIKQNISDSLEIKNIIKTNYGYYLVNIGVFDLYPKPLSSIKKHHKRNKEVFRAYITAMAEKSNPSLTIP